MKHAGVYIHIPFCRARCSYCDFATCGYDALFAERYVAAVEREIERFDLAATSDADTIYFGGGTPSLLLPAQLDRLLRAVRRRFRVAADAEITLEVDPGTASLDALREFRRAGVTRVSFGAQTFDDRELRRLNRRHTAGEIRETFDDLARAGFANVSFDLIAGLPGQTPEAFERNLDCALALRPAHLSFYILEVHEGTPLARRIERGRLRAPDEDAAAEMYRALLRRAGEAGYEHYEISNFCLPGFQARHNTKYWTRQPVHGFGCSAHSFDGRRTRAANERNALAYVRLVESNSSTIVETTELDSADEQAERLFLGLRLMRGVNLGAQDDPRRDRADEVARLTEAGLIEFSGDLMRLTPAGALLSNEVFAAFV